MGKRVCLPFSWKQYLNCVGYYYTEEKEKEDEEWQREKSYNRKSRKVK
jgi:hypothetical protein